MTTTETTSSPAVYSRRKGAMPAPPDAVYVGRPNPYRAGCPDNPWANRFTMRQGNDRDDVCDAFEVYAAGRLKTEPDWLEPLRGKSLICWCKSPDQDVRCHADWLIKHANAPKEESGGMNEVLELKHLLEEAHTQARAEQCSMYIAYRYGNGGRGRWTIVHPDNWITDKEDIDPHTPYVLAVFKTGLVDIVPATSVPD